MSPIQFAQKVHADQTYGSHPYVYHLQKVAQVLERFGYASDPALISAAYLHDVVEDTETSVEDVANIFGPEVANLVSCVTTVMAPTRKEKLSLTYPRIRSSSKAVALKLADRIANVEESLSNNSKMFTKYKSEYAGFRTALFLENEHVGLWEHLDTLFYGASA